MGGALFTNRTICEIQWIIVIQAISRHFNLKFSNSEYSREYAGLVQGGAQ